MISQIPTLRAHIWETRSWQIFHPPHQTVISQFLLWEHIIGRPGLGRSTPSLSVSNDNFPDSYSESSYLADQVLGDLSSKMAMSQVPLLRTHIWQVRSGHNYPNCPQWFHRFLLWDLIFGRPGLGRSTPSLSPSLSQMTISQIPTIRAHIWETRSWQIFHPPTKEWFHRFLLWELIFGRPGLGWSSNPLLTVISQIPTLIVHIWPTRCWGLGRSTPWMVISQIPTPRSHNWQTRS